MAEDRLPYAEPETTGAMTHDCQAVARRLELDPVAPHDPAGPRDAPGASALPVVSDELAVRATGLHLHLH